MAQRLWLTWEGLTSIKKAWSGDNVDGQACDLMFEGKLYDDIANSKLSEKLYDLARADGYIIDGWHKVPFRKVAKAHEEELKAYLRTFKPFCTKDDENPFHYYYLTEGRFVMRNKYGMIVEI